jgi:ClpP class serine protease
MTIYYALDQAELDRYYAFREMESRLRSELSPELIADIKAAVHEERDAQAARPRYETRNGEAHIVIEGTLAAKRQVSDELYGDVTTYADITKATHDAEADPLVREIVYDINSPGGSWDGIEDCAEAIKNAAKPTRAIIHTAAQSGGYFLASQTDRIDAATKGSMVGSIGVAAEVFDRTLEDGQKGIKRYVLTNRESPDKRPKVEEAEGRELIIDRLDQLYAIFENRVVEGRAKTRTGFSAEPVRALAGRTVTAEKAQELGFIDGILTERTVQHDRKRSNSTGGTMTLAEFIEQNPAAKEEIKAYAVGELGLASGVDIAKSTIKTYVDEAVSADRVRTLELLELSGVKLSDSLQSAVSNGADSGSYAKKRLREVNEAMAVSNAAALGNPKPAQHLEDQIEPKTGRQPGGPDAVMDEEVIRKMAKKGGF